MDYGGRRGKKKEKKKKKEKSGNVASGKGDTLMWEK